MLKSSSSAPLTDSEGWKAAVRPSMGTGRLSLPPSSSGEILSWKTDLPVLERAAPVTLACKQISKTMNNERRETGPDAHIRSGDDGQPTS